jgi:hypothetical protein
MYDKCNFKMTIPEASGDSDKQFSWDATWFQMYIWFTIWKYTLPSIILVKKIVQNPNSYFAYLWTNEPQTAIV